MARPQGVLTAKTSRMKIPMSNRIKIQPMSFNTKAISLFNNYPAGYQTKANKSISLRKDKLKSLKTEI
jgi:hypothetical protein